MSTSVAVLLWATVAVIVATSAVGVAMLRCRQRHVPGSPMQRGEALMGVGFWAGVAMSCGTLVIAGVLAGFATGRPEPEQMPLTTEGLVVATPGSIQEHQAVSSEPVDATTTVTVGEGQSVDLPEVVHEVGMHVVEVVVVTQGAARTVVVPGAPGRVSVTTTTTVPTRTSRTTMTVASATVTSTDEVTPTATATPGVTASATATEDATGSPSATNTETTGDPTEPERRPKERRSGPGEK